MLPSTSSRSLRRFHRPARGSVLLVALLFSLIIAISLGSFLQLSTTASRLSYRTYYQGVSMNIAETGLEHAMWEANCATTKWVGWETPPGGSATARRRTFPAADQFFTIEGGAKGQVKVYAQERVGGAPAWVAARAIITPASGEPIERWIKVTLSKKSPLNIALLGEDGIVSSGNQVVMGSWNSDPDNDPSTPPVEFDESLLNDEASLATTNINATINGGNGDINGTAAVGAASTSAINVGPQGYIGPIGTAEGTIDPNSVSSNFSADLPIPEVPAGSYTALGEVASSLTLPRPGDLVPGTTTYYYSASAIKLNGDQLYVEPGYEIILHVPRSAGDAISVGGNGGAIKVGATQVNDTTTNTTTYVSGKLRIYTDGDVSISGQGTAQNEITTKSYVATNSSVKTTISNVAKIFGKGAQKNTVIGWSYTQTVATTTTIGDTVTSSSTSGTYRALIENNATEPVAGEDIENQSGGTYLDTGTRVGQPIALQFYGTRSDADRTTYGPQSFSLSGNGSLSAIVNAPNADISAKGGGNSGFVYGSLIGETLKFTGNDCFYYDESLRAADEDSRLRIDEWNEFVSYADRNTYGSFLTF